MARLSSNSRCSISVGTSQTKVSEARRSLNTRTAASSSSLRAAASRRFGAGGAEIAERSLVLADAFGELCLRPRISLDAGHDVAPFPIERLEQPGEERGELRFFRRRVQPLCECGDGGGCLFDGDAPRRRLRDKPSDLRIVAPVGQRLVGGRSLPYRSNRKLRHLALYAGPIRIGASHYVGGNGGERERDGQPNGRRESQVCDRFRHPPQTSRTGAMGKPYRSIRT